MIGSVDRSDFAADVPLFIMKLGSYLKFTLKTLEFMAYNDTPARIPVIRKSSKSAFWDMRAKSDVGSFKTANGILPISSVMTFPNS